ncbi:uncharacterized protein N7503_006308 [Penicillium pulvis]|uniref:uncharacterized protein n=1 Tax=Penicillium pulvis TaxID=1562058 RepID=UPI002546A7F2|nr:uncharacterized protein N7503_006308 [Penicillium pulvis]KAJ5798803.1 hypothetical protein N7503_006308 [Penicillium pulvis]
MDWHKNLGFTDRLRAIQSLTLAYQQASSSDAFAEAQAQARQCENEAYDHATSKEQYDQICQNAIDAAEATSSVAVPNDSSHPSQDVFPDSTTSDESTLGETFGQYKSCFHHFDGLHSTIYRTKAQDGSVRAIKITIPHLMTAPHDAHRETRSILRDMFSGIAHIHKLGIIHRDIKPSNILMDSPNGPAYLADFGISWKEGDAGSEPSDSKITDVGTTCYRPPEILFGYRGYGTALDLWAAGCVVAESTVVGHRSLFDSGPLGSDLSLIHSIFQTLGTPDEISWPGVHVLPDWGKVEFHPFAAQSWDDILPGASSKGRDLVRQLVCYESSQRLSADEALQHSYFSAP